jgi:5-methylcytosine-specific restriction endonuclease McrA
MSDVNYSCLLLSSDWTALRVIGTKQAFKLIFTEKAEVISEFKDKLIRTVSRVFKAPAVIRLLTRLKLKFNVRLTRKNIVIRDRYRCRYCGNEGTLSSLTLDHVIPRSKGGKFTWENIVACCLDCNSKKGDRTPLAAGMSLLGGTPRRLDMFEYIQCLLRTRIGSIPEWEAFVVTKTQ